MDDAPRIKPKRRQARGIKHPRLAAAAGLADPQNVGGLIQRLFHCVAGGRILLRKKPRHKRQRKAAGGRLVTALGGADFVQRGARQTATENGVKRRQAKGKTRHKAGCRHCRTARLPRIRAGTATYPPAFADP